MARATDAAQLGALGGACASMAAYVASHEPAALAAFAVCAAALGAILAPRPWRIRAGRIGLVRVRSAWGRAVGRKGSRATTPRDPGLLVKWLWKALDPLINADALRGAYGGLNPNMGRSVALAGIATNLSELRREAGLALVISVILGIPAGIGIAALSGRAEAAALAALPPVAALFYPRTKLRIAASERKGALADEMTFFAVYCLLLSGVGKTMAHALDGIVGRGIFPALEREARVLVRSRTLGMGSIAALGDLGRNHPNRTFGDLLSGYVAAFGAGDPEAHLKSQVGELLGRMNRRLEAYKERASSLSVMVVFMMLFLPIMITPVAIIAGPQSAVFLSQVAFLAMPPMAVSACLIAHASQPRFGDTIRVDWRAPFLLAGAAGGVAAFFAPSAWIVMAASALAFSSCVVAMTHKRRRVAAAIDSRQGMFFRDMTSRISSGDPSVSHALAGIVASGTAQYGRHFGEVLEQAHSRIRRAGQTAQDVLADTAHGSWLGRFSFFLLSRIADTGTVDAWILTRTTEFVEKFVYAKRDVAAAVRPYVLVSAASPAAVVAMTWFVKAILSGMPEPGPEPSGIVAGIGISRNSLTDGFDEAINALTVASAICANVAVGKISSMSIRDAVPLLAGTVCAIVSIIVASLA